MKSSGTTTTAVERLENLHDSLSVHFHLIYQARQRMSPAPPVFALEHDLSPDKLEELKETVRRGVRAGLRTEHQRSWLPFIVYAAEIGYEYAGTEYWPSFAHATPRWVSEHNEWLRERFVQFSSAYGGAEPSGAFAEHFTIISWPITHAVLPTYLQRQLAQLLFEFSGSLEAELLTNPDELGRRLALRASDYSERFQRFCDNPALVGQVAVALLTGENEPTPYLSGPTLERIVESLSRERQARKWLKSARRSVTVVRGVQGDDTSTRTPPVSTPALQTYEPKLFLRKRDSWIAEVELPNLSVFAADNPCIREELDTKHLTVNGVAKRIRRGKVLYSGVEATFKSWPDPARPFIQLQNGDVEINALLASSCKLTPGPWWVFRRNGPGLAFEVKGKFVRPGHDYILVGSLGVNAPDLTWCTEFPLQVEDANAYALKVPDPLSEQDQHALSGAGIPVVSHVSIRPVGLVASAWDGEGAAEWLAGEPAIVGIRSDLSPTHVRISVSGREHVLDWPVGESETAVSLEDLAVGAHDVEVALLGDVERQIASGRLLVTIRDPRIRPEGASVGEGIRLTASPPRPTLAEVWGEQATVDVEGPTGAEVEVGVALRDDTDDVLAELSRSVELPLEPGQWRELIQEIRADSHFQEHYDAAESSVISVAKDGIGFATLTSERGFQPLQWRVRRERRGQVVASLTDRTDGRSTKVQFFPVNAPLMVEHRESEQDFPVPPQGGLAVATTRGHSAAAVLPTNPNETFGTSLNEVQVKIGGRTVSEFMRIARAIQRWSVAEPAVDVFALQAQKNVVDTLTQSLARLLGGNRWGDIEREIVGTDDPADFLDLMQQAVGHTGDHDKLAKKIAYNLYDWLDPGDLLMGFDESVRPYLGVMQNQPGAARFLLLLAGRPAELCDWAHDELDPLLRQVFEDRFLYRAARFAVLGTRALKEADEVQEGF